MFKTKSFWGGLASIATGIGLVFAGSVPEGLVLICGGLEAIFLRGGMLKIQNNAKFNINKH